MDSLIKINVERDGKYSVLKESFHNAPYKLTHFGSPRAQEHLELIVMTASPGIMDKDSLEITVNLRENAQLKLYTQSFNKLHPMKFGATMNTRVELAEHAVFHYIPHPVTPFRDSIFSSSNEIHLHEKATLIWGDSLTAGRIFMDEAFVFTKLHTLTRIFQNKQLIYTDNQYLTPKTQDLQGMLYFEGYTHQATLLYAGPFAALLKIEMDEILTGEYEDIEFGYTLCAPQCILLRAVGHDGELLHNFLTMLAQMYWVFTQDQIQSNEIQQTSVETAVLPKQEIPNKPAIESKKIKRNGRKISLAKKSIAAIEE